MSSIFTLPTPGNNTSNWTFKNPGEFLNYLRLQGTNLGISLGWCLLVALLGYLIIKIIIFTLKKILRYRHFDKTIVVFSLSVTDMTLKLLLAIICIDILGIEAISVAAILAAITFAIGLSLSGLLQNFVAGAYLIVSRPIAVGEYVKVSNDVEGEVLLVGVVNTTILTPDKRQIIIPNSNLAKENIINYDKEKIRRCDRNVRVALTENLDYVREVALILCDRDSRILKNPKPVVRVTSIDEWSINISIRPYIFKDLYWELWFDLPEMIKNEFEKANIKIQIPQKDVYVYQAPEFPPRPTGDPNYQRIIAEFKRRRANQETPIISPPTRSNWPQWLHNKKSEKTSHQFSPPLIIPVHEEQK